MTPDRLRDLLSRVRDHSTTVDEAAALLAAEQPPSAADLGFATVDLERGRRCGFPEVVYGEGKTPAQVAAIFARVLEAEPSLGCLATRISAETAAVLTQAFPQAEYDPVGRTFWQGALPKSPRGRVVVVTAGTTDLPVAREAYTTARVMGCDVELVCDVGVAGLHRLLRHAPMLAKADCLVVVAGMEGALPSVVGGLVPCPVVAVP
ncbi:MAG: nickel pincer cofactor biosynthesis protein LarB, partial [Planctomycetia bacterium]